MLRITVLIVVIIIVCSYEIPELIKKKMKKEIILFCLFLSISTVLIVLEISGLDIPNPLNLVRSLMSPIGITIENYFIK